MIERPSPNYNDRKQGKAIGMLVMHYTGMRDAEAALRRLTDPEAQVSSHYLIDEAGKTYRLVDEQRRAWHAGVSFWAGERDINSISIGIELVNPGHEFGYQPFPDAQMAALIELSRDILARHKISPSRVLGHSDVAPARKIDPGELFDWQRLAKAGIGRWPAPAKGPSDAAAVRNALAKIGYEVSTDGAKDKLTKQSLAAFQRRYRPAKIDGIADEGTCGMLYGLVALQK